MKDSLLDQEHKKPNLERVISSENEAKIDLGPSYKEIEEDINSIVNTSLNKLDEKNIAGKIDEVIEDYELISILNNINFNAFLDDVILPIVNAQNDKYFVKPKIKPKIERKFIIRYKLENKYQKKPSPFKEEEFPLDKKLMELKERTDDYKFTLRLILEKENLKELMDKRIDEIEKNGIFIEVDYSREEDIVNYNKKFKNKENKKKRLSSKHGYPIIIQILRRIKKKKRLGKKVFDIVNKLRDIPQKLYEDLYKKVCGKEYNPLNPLNGTQKTVVKIHKYLSELDKNTTSDKKQINDLNQAALYYLDIMLGRPQEPNKALYKARKIKPKYEKDRLDSIDKKAISDLFAATVKVEKNKDINKIRDTICFSYFGQNPSDCYTTSNKFNSKAFFDPNFDGVVQIKDYRGKNIKKNKFEGVQMRIRHSGTDMEVLLITEDNYKKLKGGEADHTEYKFFQRLMRDVSLHENPNQKFKYDSIIGFFEKMR